MIADSRDRRASPHCPTCDRPVSWSGNPARPFYSLGCKLIDLGVWLDEAYRMPGAPLSLPAPSELDVAQVDE